MLEVVAHDVGVDFLDDDVMLPQLVERRQQLLLRHCADRGDHLVCRACADHRREIRDRPRSRRQPRQSRDHGIADRARQLQCLDLPSDPGAARLTQPAGLDQRLQRLIDEERIAARPAVQQRRELLRHRFVHAEHRMHQLVDRRARERREAYQTRAAHRRQRLLGRAKGRIVLALGGIVGAEDRDSGRGNLPCDEMQQLQRGRVGPVEILEHEQERFLRREATEELGEVPEQARLQLGGVAPGHG
jgi:hypothetical protein